MRLGHDRSGSPAPVADAAVRVERVVGLVLLSIADFAPRTVLAFFVRAAAVLADETSLEGTTWFFVFVLDQPACLLMQAFQRPVVRCPGCIVVEVGDLLVLAASDVNLWEPFRAGIRDGPIVVPVAFSGRVAVRERVGVEQVHVELICVGGLDEIRFDGFDGCVDHHGVEIPIRHRQIV